MTFVKKTWKNRQSEYPNRRVLTDENGDTQVVTVAREEGSITEEGDAFSAENMNDLEERIAQAITSITDAFVLDGDVMTIDLDKMNGASNGT